MTDAEVLAIAKAIQAKDLRVARSGVSPGEYVVEGLYRVKVNYVVGEDEEYVPTADLPIRKAFALFVKYTGITGPAAMDLLVRAFNDANNLGSSVEVIEQLDAA